MRHPRLALLAALAGLAAAVPVVAAAAADCPAEAQGPQRVARAEAYFAYLRARHPHGLNQQLHIVPGVGHDGARMLTSACALHAMYGVPGCAS